MRKIDPEQFPKTDCPMVSHMIFNGNFPEIRTSLLLTPAEGAERISQSVVFMVSEMLL